MSVSVKNAVAITFMRYSFVLSKIKSHQDTADNFKINLLKNFYVFFTCLNHGLAKKQTPRLFHLSGISPEPQHYYRIKLPCLFHLSGILPKPRYFCRMKLPHLAFKKFDRQDGS